VVRRSLDSTTHRQGQKLDRIGWPLCWSSHWLRIVKRGLPNVAWAAYVLRRKGIPPACVHAKVHKRRDGSQEVIEGEEQAHC